MLASGQMSNPTRPARQPAIGYRSYLLRLWCAETPEGSWRASLEDLRTGERLGFASPELLFAYLLEQVESDGISRRLK